MNYEKIINELVDLKAQQDNQIDLNAYESGMRALADKLNKPTINKIGVNSKVYLKRHSHITGVVIDSSDVGFNHWIVRWDESSELIREYGSDLVLINKTKCK